MHAELFCLMMYPPKPYVPPVRSPAQVAMASYTTRCGTIMLCLLACGLLCLLNGPHEAAAVGNCKCQTAGPGQGAAFYNGFTQHCCKQQQSIFNSINYPGPHNQCSAGPFGDIDATRFHECCRTLGTPGRSSWCW
jgi:hypothetical protein